MKKNIDIGFVAIMANVLLWSLFPLLSHYSTGNYSVLAIAFYSQLFALITAMGFARKRTVLLMARRIPNQNTSLFVTMAGASVLLHLFFLYAFRLVDGPVATIVLEFWPLSGIAFLYFFSSNDLKKPTMNTFYACIFGGMGLLLVLFSSNEMGTGSFDSINKGVFLAIAAAIASGATILQSELAKKLHRHNSFTTANSLVFLLRLASIPPLFVCCIVFGADLLNAEVIWLGAAFGITGYALASALAIWGVRFVDRVDYILLWFLAPALGLLWLVIFAGHAVSAGALAGFCLLLCSNAFLNFGGIRRKSILYAQGSLAIIISLIVFTPSLPDANYYNALFVLMTFFVVFVSYILQKQAEFTELEIQTRLDKSDSMENSEEYLRIYRRSFTFTGEKIVLFVVACCTMGIAITFRDNTLIDDLVALSISFIVVFLTIYCFECLSEKRRDMIYFEAISLSDEEFESSYKRRLITALSMLFTFGMCVLAIIALHYS